MCSDLETHSQIIINKAIPLNDRIRSMFALRNMEDDNAAFALTKALYDDSELLAHEAAYCLGQMKRDCVVPELQKVLSNTKIPVVVRHEAAEAIAAINAENCVNILKEYLNDPSIEVAETCQIGFDRLNYFKSAHDDSTDPLYGSVDPAPPHPSMDIDFLSNLLLDPTASLFDRYRAMFALRNIGSKECVEALIKGFTCESALFKHEIGFVLGQMRNEHSIDALINVVDRTCGHPMVRHECAEALGNIATEKCINYLQTKLNDASRIVRESCEVALGISSYQNSDNFQYITNY